MIDVDVFPSDTSWLSEPTTGVHQFGGGSVYRHNVGRSLPLTLRNPSFNKFKLIEVGFGSFASVWRCLSYFRFPPPSRHFQGGSAGPKSATEVGERCGNSPAAASSCSAAR